MSLLGETLRESLATDDYDETIDGTIPGGGEAVVATLEATGASQLAGQVMAEGQYTLRADWHDDSGTVVRQETVASGVSGGTWTDLDLVPRATRVEIVVEDDGVLSGDLNVNATVLLS